MRQRVISLGFAVVGVLASAVGCAGADETDDTMVSPSGTAVSPSASTSGTTSTSGGTTSTSATSSSVSPASTSAASTSTGSTSSAAQTSEEPAGPSFATDIHPIFVAKCGEGFLCHGDDGTMAKYASATAATAFAAATKDMADINSRTAAGTMPVAEDLSTMCLSNGAPDTTKPMCLTTAELDLISAWVEAGGPE